MAPWAHEIASITVQPFKTWEYALAAESSAIHAEKPRENKSNPTGRRVARQKAKAPILVSRKGKITLPDNTPPRTLKQSQAALNAIHPFRPTSLTLYQPWLPKRVAKLIDEFEKP